MQSRIINQYMVDIHVLIKSNIFVLYIAIVIFHQYFLYGHYVWTFSGTTSFDLWLLYTNIEHLRAHVHSF